MLLLAQHGRSTTPSAYVDTADDLHLLLYAFTFRMSCVYVSKKYYTLRYTDFESSTKIRVQHEASSALCVATL